MGTKPTNKINSASQDLGELRVAQGVALTDSVTIGRTGREWRLYIEAKKCSVSRDTPSGIDITRRVTDEATVVRDTCEFLRQHAPALYRELYDHLFKLRPVDPNTPYKDEGNTAKRLARFDVKPLEQKDLSFAEDKSEVLEGRGNTSFEVPKIKIRKGHWARDVHDNTGNYTTEKSGDRAELRRTERESDIGSIKEYLKNYRKLARHVSGESLWLATYEPSFRDPYYTCMQLCIGEAQMPSHFLALIHYGIGLHMMYEQSLSWKKRDNPKSVPSALIDSLKDSFDTLARLYREDFC